MFKSLLFIAGMMAFTLNVFAQAENKPIKITNGPVVENLSSTGATVAWSTNVSAGSEVRYGTSPDAMKLSKRAPWGGYTHRLALAGLQAGTKYYYQVESGQAQGTGTSAKSAVLEFTTPAENPTPTNLTTPAKIGLAITLGPHIEHTTANTASVSWRTNAAASAEVKYGTDAEKLLLHEQQPWGGTEHRVLLKNLKPDTLYYYQAISAEGENAQGEGVSRVQSFRTNSAKQ